MGNLNFPWWTPFPGFVAALSRRPRGVPSAGQPAARAKVRGARSVSFAIQFRALTSSGDRNSMNFPRGM